MEKLDCRHIEEIREIAKGSFPVLWSEKDFAYFLAHECGFCRGTFSEDGKLLCYCLGLLVQGELDIVSIATLPSARRQKHAENLLKKVIADSKAQKVFLEVESKNEFAIGLYNKLGFVITQTRPGYYQGTKDALVMSYVPSP